MKEIYQKRADIDRLDVALVDLLVQRAVLSRQISVLKLRAGIPIADPRREREVIRNATVTITDPAYAPAIEAIYRAILVESRGMQEREQADVLATRVLR